MEVRLVEVVVWTHQLLKGLKKSRKNLFFEEKKMPEPKNVVVGLIAGLSVLIGVILLYVQEIQWFQNSIGVSRLVWGSLIFGFLFGVGLIRDLEEQLSESKRKEKFTKQETIKLIRTHESVRF